MNKKTRNWLINEADTIVSGGPAAARREGKTRRKKCKLHYKWVRNESCLYCGSMGGAGGARTDHGRDRLCNKRSTEPFH